MKDALFDILRVVTRLIIERRQIDAILQETTQLICRQMEVDVCTIYTYDSAKKKLVLTAATGFKGGVGFEMPLDQGLAGLVFSTRSTVNLNEPQNHPCFRYVSETGEEDYHSYLGVPMLAGDSGVGIFVLQSRRASVFPEDVVDLAVTLASQLSTVVAQHGVEKVLKLYRRSAEPQPQAEELRVADSKERTLLGSAISPGKALGPARLLRGHGYWDEFELKSCEHPASEAECLKRAVELALQETMHIQERAAKIFIEADASIFFAQLLLLEDEVFISEMLNCIEDGHYTAASAVKMTVDRFREKFEATGNVQLKERATDLVDIGLRLIHQIEGIEAHENIMADESFVIVAEELLPSDMVRLPTDRVLGIVCDRGGVTSHAAILARSIGIPAVMGVSGIPELVHDNQLLIVDGDSGEVFINPTSRRQRALQAALQNRKAAVADPSRKRVTHSQDEVRVKVQANICILSDFNILKSCQIDGVGLYRSEFMFMVHENLPSENEQYRVYRQLGRLAGSNMATLRTLDVGGDKPLKYLDCGDERDPMLGYRSIRILLDRPDIFEPHLSAMLRASQRGNIRILFPMVAHVEDMRACRAFAEEVVERLRKSYGPKFSLPPLGAMVEMPSTVWQIDRILDHADFVSIGTNDLVQYFFAVDRGNERVSSYYKPMHPVILDAINTVIKACEKKGKSVSLCGELAGDPMGIPLLLGLGLREFSMAPTAVSEAKRLITRLNVDECKALARKALRCSTESEVRELIGNFMAHHGLIAAP